MDAIEVSNLDRMIGAALEIWELLRELWDRVKFAMGTWLDIKILEEVG